MYAVLSCQIACGDCFYDPLSAPKKEGEHCVSTDDCEFGLYCERRFNTCTPFPEPVPDAAVDADPPVDAAVDAALPDAAPPCHPLLQDCNLDAGAMACVVVGAHSTACVDIADMPANAREPCQLPAAGEPSPCVAGTICGYAGADSDATCIAVCDYATYPDIRDPERCGPDEICVGPFVFDDIGACLVP